MSIQFQSTVWTQIRKAKENDPSALNNFILRYQKPIKMYLFKKGIKQQDADDLTQDIFTIIFEKKILQTAEKKKGRLRSLLLAVANNVLMNFQKKKARPQQLLDDLPDDLTQNTQTSEEFDHFWIINLIKAALERLKTECKGLKVPYYELIKLYMEDELDYASIAQELSLTLDQVKFYIHQAKKRLIAHIKEEIESYSSSKEEYDDELRSILRYFK